MKFKKYAPTLYIYAPNRTTQYGAIPVPIHLNINYRFNTFSEMQFEIKRYYYDERKEEWVENPLYDKIEKNNLIKIPNDNPIFKYKASELYEDSEYDIDRNQDGTANYDSQLVRIKDERNSESALRYTPDINHCNIQSETELFNVGAMNGYGWKWYNEIYTGLDAYGNNEPRSSGYVINTDDIEDIVNESFFPIEVGDVIAMGCQQDADHYFVKGATKYRFSFCPYFYTEANSSSCVHMGIFTNTEDSTNYYHNPIKRYVVKDGDLGKYTYRVNGVTKTKYNKKGYVRFKGTDLSDHSSGFYYAPATNNIRIFSGERNCNYVYSKYSNVTLQHGIPWWVIANVEKDEDGINSVKKVTVYSYEYTLTNRTFSVSGDTLPLYIPDNIPKVINSSECPIEKWKETSTSSAQTVTGSQRMKRGLVNQILDNLSGWKIKYVSTGVCTRYRQIEDVDNANIYTYLMNTLQEKYQCYIFFDTVNLYINIIDQTNLISDAINRTNLMLSWRNALKAMTIKDIDDNYATALRVHSEEDTYGLGLVNLNGTNVIYNFNNVLDKLDYVVDSNHTHSGTPYTLKELVESYQTQITNSTTINSYRSTAMDLIESSIEVVKCKTRLSKMLTEYLKEVDKNNILVKAKCESDRNATVGNKYQWNYADEAPEVPPVSEQFDSGKNWSYSPNNTNDHYHFETPSSSTTVRDCWASRKNFQLIQQAAGNYWDAYSAYDTAKTTFEKSTDTLRQTALKFSLNINTLRENFASNNNNGVPTSGYKPIFTPLEALELYKYIYEADWTNENVVFNEEFTADDIYNALVDLFNVANSEMDNIYCKPTQDFETDIVNITRIPELKGKIESLYLGGSLYIRNDEKWVQPILLEIKLDYDNYKYSPMVFTTDYNRKPKEMRFYELFSTIQQTSVQTPTYTFDN